MNRNTHSKAADALARIQAGESNNDVLVKTLGAARGWTDIRPRENVLTYLAWRALGRHVRKGEHGLTLTVWIERPEERDSLTGAVTRKASRFPKRSTVFHESQTDPD